MPVTIDIFLWVSGLFFVLLLAILGLVWGLKTDLKPMTSLVKTVDNWLRKEGLGKVYGLTESDEFRALLQEEARADFAKGALGALAFATLMLAIGTIIAGLSKK